MSKVATYFIPFTFVRCTVCELLDHFFRLRSNGISVVWLKIFQEILLTALLRSNIYSIRDNYNWSKYAKNNYMTCYPHPFLHILNGRGSDFVCSVCEADVHLYHSLWQLLSRWTHRAMTSTGCNLFGCQKHRCYYCSYWHTHPHCLSFTFTLLYLHHSRIWPSCKDSHTVICQM